MYVINVCNFSNYVYVPLFTAMQTKNTTKTVSKDPVDQESLLLLKHQLSREYTLYDQLKERFYKLHKAVRQLRELQQV